MLPWQKLRSALSRFISPNPPPFGELAMFNTSHDLQRSVLEFKISVRSCMGLYLLYTRW